MAHPRVNYEGQKFNNWTVIKKINSQKYICRCSCNLEKEVYIKNILDGSSKSCGHERKMVGQKFNHWTILEELGKGKVICQCDCGTVKELYKKAVINGQTKSCGCQGSGFINLKGQQYNEWTVLEFKGNAQWLCRCSCGKESILTRRALLEGLSKSCGCKQSENLLNTYKERFGDISIKRRDNPRESWQIEALRSKKNLESFINSLDYKPTVRSLSETLNTGAYTISCKIHEYGLEKLMIDSQHSSYEYLIIKYLKDLNANMVIEHSNRKILKNKKELDIYIPERKLAIEFNGTYWHSSLYKDEMYHQEKSIEALKNKIRLIHIFEHEWEDEITRNKLLNIIKNMVAPELVNKVYARNTEVHELTIEETREFLNKYHLQNYSASSINLGLKDKDGQLLSVMTFGKPRFNQDYEYEIIRYCNKDNVSITGGAEKLFEYFKDKYNPNSVITYCDIGKFTGQVYVRLGFKPAEITQPNYVWVEGNTNNILTRYQTQKHKLIELGLGTEDQTEDKIMTNIGYIKIYDSGNLKLHYRKGGTQ